MRTKKRFTRFAYSALIGFIMVSCQKSDPTLAKITVLDTDGNRLENAEVRIYGEPTTTEPHGAMIIDKTLITNNKGEVIFDFTPDFNVGQAGFAVLNLEVTVSDELEGEGLIKIEEEKLNEHTVIMEPM